jgi:hypothetical protein
MKTDSKNRTHFGRDISCFNELAVEAVRPDSLLGCHMNAPIRFKTYHGGEENRGVVGLGRRRDPA